jgi:hypothetical protein
MATTRTNWERLRFPSKKVHDQIQAIADEGSTPEVRLTLLASLKESLEGYELAEDQEESRDKKQPAKKPKKSKWKQGPTFLMYTTEEDQNKTPMTMLGAPPREKYPFKIAYRLPFLSFPIGDGRTQEDLATMTGILDTGGCCNMGWLKYHQEIATQFPQLVDKLIF